MRAATSSSTWRSTRWARSDPCPQWPATALRSTRSGTREREHIRWEACTAGRDAPPRASWRRRSRAGLEPRVDDRPRRSVPSGLLGTQLRDDGLQELPADLGAALHERAEV